ncbi:hypothetical protein [Archaeoglobus fulgidus]|jgi:choline-glycine betaine transporter|uniref:Uncharacterized protein n=1 Tax=Archaeoglobus fulgidus DSM 8774 TaxID=1344584 RepID=A0A075WGY3_ARCFL|nr:hypothetical protein [Archaeoglobus fulgidus]AIG99271.1 hypothetical protein AFULGI_00025590 [Archaeoglobus fulgidus DSM 8774]
MKDEQRENLMRSLQSLSISGSVVMTFAIALIVLKASGFSLLHSATIAAALSIAVLILRMRNG